MKLGRALLALGAAYLVAGATACALNFDQFQPGDASAPPSGPEGSKEPPGTDDAANIEPPGTDAEGMGSDDTSADVAVVETPDASRADARAPSDGGLDAAASCTPPQSCLMTAQMCAMMCATQEQMCSMRCTSGGCRTQCRNTQSMCNSQCQDTCTSCAQSAGCSTGRAACTDAG